MPVFTEKQYQEECAINKAIAIRLGYIVAKLPGDDYRSQTYPFALYPSYHALKHRVDCGASSTVELAWGHTPSWAGDLNRASELMDGIVFQLHNQWGTSDDWGSKWVCNIMNSDGYKNSPTAYDTPALAICNAWLLWKEAQE